MVILGPKNLPFVKIFLVADPKKLARNYAYYNHCQVVCHQVVWFRGSEAAKQVRSSLEAQISVNHSQVSSRHFEYNYDDYEMQLMLDKALMQNCITWAMSDEHREEFLLAEASKLYQRKIRKERAALGVVIDE